MTDFEGRFAVVPVPGKGLGIVSQVDTGPCKACIGGVN